MNVNDFINRDMCFVKVKFRRSFMVFDQFICEEWNYIYIQVGRAFPIVISSDFRMGKHSDDDHEEDTPYFISISEQL